MISDRFKKTCCASAAGFTAFVNIYALQSLLPMLAEAFGASSERVGLAISATALAVALAAPFAGWLAGRLTRLVLVRISVGGLVVCGLQVALAGDLESLIAWRFVQGLFLPLLVAGVISFLAQDFPREALGQATSNYVTWTIVGGFTGRWVGGLVAGQWGWRPALFALAGLNALAGLVLLASLTHPHERVGKKRPPTARDFLQTLRVPELRAAYMVGFGSLFTLVGTFTYVTFYLSASPFHLGPEALGQMFCVYLLGIAVTPQVGRFLPRWGVGGAVRRTSRLAMLGLILSLVPKAAVVIAALGLICVAAFATQAAVSSFIAGLEPEKKTAVAGLYLSFYYLGGSLGAYLPGFAQNLAGWTGCVLTLAAVQLALHSLSRRWETGG